MIIDAHVHLWERQQGILQQGSSSVQVYDVGNGCSYFDGEIRQMLPPYMTDGKNSVERLLANMNYGNVDYAVVTQEYIDGNQDKYLLHAKQKAKGRLKICSLYEEKDTYEWEGFDGIKICASRLGKVKLISLLDLFQKAERDHKFISIDLQEGDSQVKDMEDLIQACPNLKIAIGHFGMITRKGWQEQIRLACYPNVYIESGGITWLFHQEFYPYKSGIHGILAARDICGMDKLMWGSDYPRTMTAITYIMSYDFVLKSNLLSEKEKNQFLSENASSFYGFPLSNFNFRRKSMLEE